MKRSWRVLLAVVALAAAPAQALSLFSPADRGAVEPLRTVRLAEVLDGRPVPPEALVAADKLPERCTDFAALRVVDGCDPLLRCGWLAARAEVLRAWSGGDRAARRQAAGHLHAVALRTEAGTTCGRKGNARERWEADAHLARLDDAQVQLALLLELGPVRGGAVVDPAGERKIAGLLQAARARGVAGLSGNELREARNLLHLAQSRRSWLDGQPAVAALREALPALWAPIGRLPADCGGDLLRPELLGDRWRGQLVRDVVPAALGCLGSRLPAALSRAGRPATDATGAARLAGQLGELARRDSGGRTFGTDRAVVERVERLVAALRPVEPKARATATQRSRRPAKKVNAPAPARPPASRRGPEKASSEASRRRAPADRELVALAERAAEALDGPSDLVERARKARSSAARDQVVGAILVELHRDLCAPLEWASAEDVAAVRAVLATRGLRAREDACHEVAGLAGIEQLLDAATGLSRLAAGVRLRSAARAVAAGQPPVARRLLDEVPEALRGTTWTLLRAWVARAEQDPVTASQVLAGLDEATLSRLRSSGEESVARVIAHATAPARP